MLHKNNSRWRSVNRGRSMPYLESQLLNLKLLYNNFWIIVLTLGASVQTVANPSTLHQGWSCRCSWWGRCSNGRNSCGLRQKKLTDVNDFGEVVHVCLSNGDIVRLKSGSAVADATTSPFCFVFDNVCWRWIGERALCTCLFILWSI